MLFASFSYILIFLPIVVCVTISLRKLFGPRASQAWVLLASIAFYAKNNPFNLVYLFASVGSNWIIAQAIDRTKEPINKKRILVSGLVLNVAYLCAFKYLAFFASIIAFALPKGFIMPTLAFPLGISFFTITQVMYLVDCYEGSLLAGSLFDHATFVIFFPYLISGPLGRPKRMRHQFDHFGGLDGMRFPLIARGVYLFSLGLFKKTVFANAFAQLANIGNGRSHISAFEAWVFSVAYVMEVYFDFSGYSDMAIGSALLLGIDIPRNFDSPFSATSIIEFWQRWHISLTGFITTYLFTPIFKSFKKRTLLTSSIATFLAMGIAGLWHGAGWTFVIYGFLHGAYLAINQTWRKKSLPKIPKFVGWLLTAIGVNIAFIYFGANTFSQGTARMLNLFNPDHPFTTTNLTSLGMKVDMVGIKVFGLPLLGGILISIFGPSSEQRGREFIPTALNASYAAVLTLVSFLMMNSTIPVPFVYFHF